MKQVLKIKNLSILFLLVLVSGCGFKQNNSENNTTIPQISKVFQSVDCTQFHLSRSDIECGYLEVPNDYFEKTTTYSLPVVIKKAVNNLENLSPIIYIEGGPGGSALDNTDSYLSSLEHFTNRDVILYDQRGTGYSDPFLTCDDIFENYNKLINEKWTELNEQNITKYTITQNQYDINFQQLTKEKYDSCAESLSAKEQAPKYFTTRNSAYDIESLRESLGYDKIILLGASYGTRLSLEYMEILPQNLETVILDGVLPENSDLLNNAITEKKDAISRYLEVCKNDITCNSAYPNFEDELFVITDALTKNSHQFITIENNITIYHTTTGSDIFQKFFDLLYTSYYYDKLPYYIHNIYTDIQNDKYSYLEYLSALYSDTVNNDDPLRSNVMNAFISRNDHPLSINDMLSNYQSLGRYQNSTSIYNIFNWNDMHISYGGIDKLIEHTYDSNVPTLLLSGTLDPITPVHYGENVAHRLPNSTHLIFQNQGHVQFRSECGKLTIKTFIDNNDSFIPPDCVNDDNKIDFL
ncbi:MAG: pimeloyl-ACP methyl ester carboxylesterase [Sulfurimonas sp.]|jgi:pimeloyl-ACP methyl ester carboxylesterase|uniref:alpha/beta fold hydrolase n=1 Tax=Sulfurimonas sp. TaxID=2022749 RepID=UPI0039E26F71